MTEARLRADLTGAAVPFGDAPDRGPAVLFTLENSHIRVGIADYGGRIVSLEAPDVKGRREHVVLGFDSADAYESAGLPFGALLGRNANRIGGGRFTLDGKTYHLSKNENGSTLHGGAVGFDKVIWDVTDIDAMRLVLRHVSPDGDQGFPGEVTVHATYRLDGDTLWLEFDAQTTKSTPLSLSAHPYFNLAGTGTGDIYGHEIEIAADHFLPTDDRQIPLGEIRDVAGTVFDFRSTVTVGARIRAPDRQLMLAHGYDHYFVLREPPTGQPRLAARVRDPHSGRVLEILTTQPGTQFYTANSLDGSLAGHGGAYRQSDAFALEPQGFPDAPNRPEFPSMILRPGETYREAIGYRFTAA
jgi:aldose 1-epimerase